MTLLAFILNIPLKVIVPFDNTSPVLHECLVVPGSCTSGALCAPWAICKPLCFHQRPIYISVRHNVAVRPMTNVLLPPAHRLSRPVTDPLRLAGEKPLVAPIPAKGAFPGNKKEWDKKRVRFCLLNLYIVVVSSCWISTSVARSL